MKQLEPKRRIGFKPPGYYCTDDTIKILKEFEMPFNCMERYITFFKGNEERRDQYSYDISEKVLIQTHTNGITRNSVEKIEENLSWSFEVAQKFKGILDLM